MTLAQVFFLIAASTPASVAPADEPGTLGDLLAMQAAAERSGFHG